jgi:hypothetical protein
MDPFDVERAQAFLDEFGKCSRERRLLTVIVALQEIDGIRVPGRDLLADGGRRFRGHAV